MTTLNTNETNPIDGRGHRRARASAVARLADPIVALAVLLFAFFETRLPQFSSSNSFSNNVIFFLLINLNIILLVAGVFLVARNLVKLVFERRRRMLGSHLRTRLVLAFVAVSIFSRDADLPRVARLHDSSIENWFNVQVESSLAGSLEVAQAYYQKASRTSLRARSREIAKTLADPRAARARATRGAPSLARSAPSPTSAVGPGLSPARALAASRRAVGRGRHRRWRPIARFGVARGRRA